MSQKTAIIIGAGPSGLTAAYELLKRTDIKPVIIEKSEYIGGISRTVNHNGNRMDIGGHRFFSKSERITKWWLSILPLESIPQAASSRKDLREAGLPLPSDDGADPDSEDLVMMIRHRKSRIYYLQRFFDYPISLSLDTLSKLGFIRSFRILLSYVKSVLFPIKEEKNIEQFFINRFGKELYLTFFKSYTEKLWGVTCDEIDADWGVQRIKGLSITKAIEHALRRALTQDKGHPQRNTETSLIGRFLYPKYGPGQMWEEVARNIKAMGGEIVTGLEADTLYIEGDRVKAVKATDKGSGDERVFEGDYFFSTMPIKELMRGMQAEIPQEIVGISEGLVYRDFIVVGLLLKELMIKDGDAAEDSLIEDQWIYIQEPEVQVGRMQLFNNWSPYLVTDPTNAWVGLEYFCYETDRLWGYSDEEMVHLAIEELEKMGMARNSGLLDSKVIRMPKAYPAYFGTYYRFDELKDYIDRFENLFLIGRNGMHKYNNQDHSMLTAMIAVDNIVEGKRDKSDIWAVNIEEEYLESQ
jgi:protoporphyrinogen oxidase